ncbi:hypothetical protein NBRC116597_02560 [Phaeobacter sp. NW0010-22]
MAAIGSKPLLISRLSNVGCGLFSELYKVPFLRIAALGVKRGERKLSVPNHRNRHTKPVPALAA